MAQSTEKPDISESINKLKEAYRKRQISDNDYQLWMQVYEKKPEQKQFEFNTPDRTRRYRKFQRRLRR
jgi:hypothetical protein